MGIFDSLIFDDNIFDVYPCGSVTTVAVGVIPRQGPPATYRKKPPLKLARLMVKYLEATDSTEKRIALSALRSYLDVGLIE